MKKSIITSSMAMVVILVIGMTTAYADGATVAKKFGCGITPAHSGLSSHLFTTESHEVDTPSGNTSLICHFDVPEALQGEVTKAMQQSGFPCDTFAGSTYDTKAVTNKNRVLLVCQLP